ncbi:MAG: hypothetical protein AAF636_23355, partial [Pseudomonadota bacterium]
MLNAALVNKGSAPTNAAKGTSTRFGMASRNSCKITSSETSIFLSIETAAQTNTRERETKNKKVATVLVETSTLVKAPNPAVCRMANNAHWFSKKPDTATI